MSSSGAGFRLVVALLAGYVLGATTAGAEERMLYQWRDESGQVHFSDKPPDRKVPEVSSRPLPRLPPPGGPDEYYSIQSQANRMREQRREITAEREEAQQREEERALRRAQLEAARAVRKRAEREASDRAVYVQPAYPWYPVYPRPPIVHPRPPGWHAPPPPRPRGSLGSRFLK